MKTRIKKLYLYGVVVLVVLVCASVYMFKMSPTSLTYESISHMPQDTRKQNIDGYYEPEDDVTGEIGRPYIKVVQNKDGTVHVTGYMEVATIANYRFDDLNATSTIDSHLVIDIPRSGFDKATTTCHIYLSFVPEISKKDVKISTASSTYAINVTQQDAIQFGCSLATTVSYEGTYHRAKEPKVLPTGAG